MCKFASLLLIPLLLGGCTITFGPFEGRDEDRPTVLPPPKPVDGDAPPSDGPTLDAAAQARKDEVDRYIADVIYQKGKVLHSVELPSGDVYDFVDRGTLPALPVEVPDLSLFEEAWSLPPGVTLGRSELEEIPALAALAATATPFLRPTFWPYIVGETDATSIEDYLDRYQVAGQPTSSEHLYGGYWGPVENRGLSGFINQYRPEVEAGSFSLMEFAVACPKEGAAQEAIGVVISVDKVNPFAWNRKALQDGAPRLHIEYGRLDPQTGKIKYAWDSVDGKFVHNPLRVRHHPGQKVEHSVKGGAQVEHLATIFQSPTGDWWIGYQGELLGYYPASLFQQLQSGGCRTHYYGEVARMKPATIKPWPKTEMGSGEFAAKGAGNAASIRNPKYFDMSWWTQHWEANPTQPPALTEALPFKNACYTIDGLSVSLDPAYRRFYLGGPGGKNTACTGP